MKRLILPSFVWLFCVAASSLVLADASEKIAQLQSADVSTQEWHKLIVELGKAGEASRNALAVLRGIAADVEHEAIVTRALASWAIERIEPWPASEAPRTFHVAQNHPKADDANPGTEELPWKTIHKAAETLKPGDTVLIHAGEYRETARPFLGGTSFERMITYKAAPGEQPVMKGSDIWQTDWKDEGGGIWSTPYTRHDWDHPEKWKSPEKGPAVRCEQIYVDGTFLKHVATRDELRKLDTFYTADDGTSGTLYIHPTGDAPPSSRTIERSMRQHCFYPAVKGLGYIRVQGLTMRHSAGPEFSQTWAQIGTRPIMSVRYGNHWIIEDNVIEWSNAQGLDVGAWSWGDRGGGEEPDVSEIQGFHQVRRNRCNFNAVSGIAGTDGIKDILFEDNETSYNGHKGNFWSYEVAGMKLHQAKRSVIRRHIANENEGFGIWLDWDCIDNRITQSILISNRGGGFFLEASDGPNLVDCNVILGTREAPPPPSPNVPWGDGVYGHDANRLIVTHNYVADCDGFGVRLRNLFGREGPGKRPTTTSHNRIFNNFLIDNTRGAICFNPEVKLSKDNRSDHNVLWQKGGKINFQLEHGGSGVDWTKTEIGKALKISDTVNAEVPLELWRKILKRDVNSQVVSPDEIPFSGLTPEQIRDKLVEMAPELAVPKDENAIKPIPVKELIEKARES